MSTGGVRAEGKRPKTAKSRFAANDSRFQRPKDGDKHGGKVRLDARFAELFTNPDFAENFELDPLGRRVQQEDSVAHKLRRVYALDTDATQQNVEDGSAPSDEQSTDKAQKEAPSEEVIKEVSDLKKASIKKRANRTDEKQEKPSSSRKASVKAKKTTKNKKKQQEEEATDAQDVAPKEAVETSEDADSEGLETKRLAVCKCDWDRVKAVDILVLLQSFAPATGAVLSVTIYPSRFGYQRMKEEEQHGPNIFRTKKGRKSNGDVDPELLRQYEKEKLDYYYAVAECDSVTTAAEIYKACEGLEFERTSNIIDLSFIPDDVTFDLPPRETAQEIPSNYEAPSYYTKALQHSKVELTWDAEDSQRTRLKEKSKQSLDELKMSDFKAFLASESEESDLEEDDAPQQLAFEVEMPPGIEDVEEPKRKRKTDADEEKIDPSKREKYKSLLNLIEGENEEEQQDMEITFVPGLSEKVQSLLDAKDDPSALKKRKRKAAKEQESDQESDFFTQDNAWSDDELPEGVMDDDGELPEGDNRSRKKQKKTKKHKKIRKDEEQLKREAELALLTIDENLDTAALKHKTAEEEETTTKTKSRRARKDRAKDEAKAAASLDLSDPRFHELVTSPEFAIDPTRLKKNSETVNKIQRERSRLRGQEALSAPVDTPSVAPATGGTFSDPSLQSLLSSVKSKSVGSAPGRRQGNGKAPPEKKSKADPKKKTRPS